MSDTIDFWFDFSSPYGYLASSRSAEIESETGRQVIWKPYLMGALFKQTGRQPLTNHPMVWDYARNDVTRTSRKFGIDIKMPEPFPIATVSACRAYYWTLANHDEATAKKLTTALYAAYFGHNRNISDKQVVADVAGETGLDTDAVLAGLNDPSIKETLRLVIEEAAGKGIFGSPFFDIDGEHFWGVDHIDDLISWGRDGAW